MSNYTLEEVDTLIDMLRAKLGKTAPRASGKSQDGKPILNKTERTIRYLEQRHKHFNPTKEMLQYIIDIAEKSDLNKALLEKMKEDILTKR
jgi:uncharacterized membrane protein YgaE (UPF0421/DUF939 family)